MELSKLSIEELADLLAEKTASYHTLIYQHSVNSDADLNKFGLLKGEIKDIQNEINKRYAKKSSGN